MKLPCLLRQGEYHTTVSFDPEDATIGSCVEVPGLVGVWEIVEVYPCPLIENPSTAVVLSVSGPLPLV